MMRVFRSAAGKVAAFVFAFLMLLFVLTSVDWSQVTGGSRSTVGKIDGVSIPLQQFQQMVQSEVAARQQQNGRSLSEEEVAEVRDAVWQNLIQQRVLDREFTARHITVSPDELAETIQNNPPPQLMQAPEFQTDGRFDLQKYQAYLRSAAGSQIVPLLEQEYASQIRQAKLMRVVTSDVYVSDPELWQIWRDTYEKATIEVARVLPAAVIPDSAAPITEAEARDFYQKNPDRFKRPTTAYLSYIQLLRFADASDSTAALKRATDLRAEILAGAPFAEVATRESADSGSAANGGLLAEFGKGQMDPAFEKAAMSLPLNVVSEPVLSQFGYHLIKVEGRTGGKVKARHILIPVEITGQHRNDLDTKADQLEALAAGKLDPAALDTAARALGLTVGAVNPLQQGSRAQIGFQVIPDAGVWAFQAAKGETSPVIEVDYAYFVFRLDSTQAEGVPPFDAIKADVEAAARDEKKIAQGKSVAEALVRRVGEGSTLEQAARAVGANYQVLGPFTRINPPIRDTRVVGAAFGLELNKLSGIIANDQLYYVMRVTKREPADSAAFLKDYDAFRAQQVRLARQDRVRSYLEALETSAKVEDNRAQIFRTAAQAEAAQPATRSR